MVEADRPVDARVEYRPGKQGRAVLVVPVGEDVLDWQALAVLIAVGNPDGGCLAERGGGGDEAGSPADTVDGDRPRVGTVLVSILETLRDAARHQIEPRTDTLV